MRCCSPSLRPAAFPPLSPPPTCGRQLFEASKVSGRRRRARLLFALASVRRSNRTCSSCGWPSFPPAAAPLAEPMRPDTPHQPLVESVKEPSDVGPFVSIGPKIASVHRSLATRQPANLIFEVADRFSLGYAYSDPWWAPGLILLVGRRIRLLPRLILSPGIRSLAGCGQSASSAD